MITLLFPFFGLAAIAVFLVLARDQRVQRERFAATARSTGMVAAAAVVVLVVLTFLNLMSGDFARALVTTLILLASAVMLAAVFVTFRDTSKRL